MVLPIQAPPLLLGETPVPEVSFTCPITCEEFRDPYILLEDGFTYEKTAIERWLRDNPTRSPMIGDIPSATLRPNHAIEVKSGSHHTVKVPECPITREPFREPYYCLEDGHTYEKEAIIRWYTESIENGVKRGLGAVRVVSPVSGNALHSLTLVPNKILFKEGIPATQDLLLIEVDVAAIFERCRKERGAPICKYDPVIRALLEAISNLNLSNPTAESREKQKKLVDQFAERRVALGLTPTQPQSFWNTLDLSHLDLSNLHLKGFLLKGATLREVDLSHSVLKNCSFARACFVDCNLEGTVFLECDFWGEETSFFGTNLERAKISSGCSMEKGITWHRISNWEEMKKEFSQRGALNADSLELLSRQEANEWARGVRNPPPRLDPPAPSIPAQLPPNPVSNGEEGPLELPPLDASRVSARLSLSRERLASQPALATVSNGEKGPLELPPLDARRVSARLSLSSERVASQPALSADSNDEENVPPLFEEPENEEPQSCCSPVAAFFSTIFSLFRGAFRRLFG